MAKKDIEMGQKPVVVAETAKVAPIEMGTITASKAAPIEMGQIDAAKAPIEMGTINAAVAPIEMGQVVANATAPDAPVAATVESTPPWEEPPAKAPEAVVTSAPTPVSEFEAEFKKMIASLSPAAQSPLLRIFEYTQLMKPGMINTPAEGVRNQVNLYRSILTVINSLGEEFDAAYNVLLRIAYQFETAAFGELYIFRFMDQLTLSAEGRKGFARILNLIKATAEPSSRAAVVRQINMDATLQYDVSEIGKQNIYNYYKL